MLVDRLGRDDIDWAREAESWAGRAFSIVVNVSVKGGDTVEERRFLQKINPAMASRTARPPTTPLTVAPILVDEDDGDRLEERGGTERQERGHKDAKDGSWRDKEDKDRVSDRHDMYRDRDRRREGPAVGTGRDSARYSTPGDRRGRFTGL